MSSKTTLTNKGALLITVPGKNDEVQRCITAHVDTLGAMVKEIKEDITHLYLLVLFDNLSLLHIFRQIELLLLCLLKDY
jgi:hypothetical protein